MHFLCQGTVDAKEMLLYSGYINDKYGDILVTECLDSYKGHIFKVS